MLSLALYQPEIPHNTGALQRLSACLGVALDIIEPCGFIFSDRHLRRAGMDYIDYAFMRRHTTWQEFLFFVKERNHRLVMVTGEAKTRYIDFDFSNQDILLMGQESCGFPEALKKTVPLKIKIPMCADRRSLNLALASSMVVGEALRQISGFPMGSLTHAE